MEPTYTRLHQTAAIGENSKRRFLRDMAGVHWGPPCFGYQGGPQQTPAIPPEKSELSHGNFETKCPKAIVVPAHFYIGALVVYPPSPPTTEHSREWAVKGRNARRLRRLALDGPPRLCHPSRRGGGYILQSRPLSHEWERAGG